MPPSVYQARHIQTAMSILRDPMQTRAGQADSQRSIRLPRRKSGVVLTLTSTYLHIDDGEAHLDEDAASMTILHMTHGCMTRYCQ